MTNSLYSQAITDHYHNPRFKGSLDKPDIVGIMRNPSCGDMVIFTLKVANLHIREIRFEGVGCVMSQAVASMLAQSAVEKSLEEISTFSHDTIVGLIGMNLGPVRMRCASLSLDALQKGINDYAQSGKNHERV